MLVFVPWGSSDHILTAPSWSPGVASGSNVTLPDALQSAALAALGYAGALLRSLLRSHVRGEETLSLDTPHLTTAGFHGRPSELLCAETAGRRPLRRNSNSGSVPACRFHIPRPLAEHLADQSSEVVQVLLDLDGPASFAAVAAAAHPPISTAVVAMEISTPQGRPIPVRDLSPERAIRLTLPRRRRPGVSDHDGGSGGGEGGGGGGGDGSDPSLEPPGMRVFPLPAGAWVNFTVLAVAGLNEKAGLYLSLNFSLVPGTVQRLLLLLLHRYTVYLLYVS